MENVKNIKKTVLTEIFTALYTEKSAWTLFFQMYTEHSPA